MPYSKPQPDPNTVPPAHTDWFTIDQACAYLQIGRDAMREFRRRGVIKDHKLGQTVRISKKELDDMLANSDWDKLL